jgi:hypothetical protein
MFIKFFVVGAFFLFGFASCNPLTSGLPKEAEEAAISDQKKGYEKYEFKNFKVTCSKEEEITPAETANGTTEKWCARLEYIFQRPSEEKWQDADNTWNGIDYQSKDMGKLLLKTNDVWQTNQKDKFCKCVGK